MELGFETIGNAILICHDRRPILVTDPWIKGSAYFGSWTLSHQIPDEQMNSIEHCEFVWISHGHPDHLSAESLKVLNMKKFLVPDHVGGRIFNALKDWGYDVHILKDKVWTKLSDRIRILSLCDYNQDAALLIDINGRLVINMNDGSVRGWTRFVQNIVKNYQISFHLRLHGYGDADMINYFDEDGVRIPPDPPVYFLGPYIARDTEYFGAKFFVPFSSMHKYQRQDSIWAQQYYTPLTDYAKGWDSKSSEILPAFIKYDCMNDTWEEINPPETPLIVRDPEEFGDEWEEQLDKAELSVVAQYFQAIHQLTKTLGFINIRVGRKDSIIELNKKKFDSGITFEAPRHSLMVAIHYEIFDDMLIGNFMKTTLHGKLKSQHPSLYPYFAPYVPKFADNGRAKSKKELQLYFKEYRKRAESQRLFDLWLIQKFDIQSKLLFRSYIPQESFIYQTAKRAYRLFR